MEYGFVILHYMAYEMTCECVDLLLNNFGSQKIHIVIVDNASSNGSGAELEKRYSNIPSVTVLLNKENLGFAKGNNIGYSYLKEHFDCDFMVIMNNDVLVKDKDFLDKIPEIYTKKEFAVLGPDIYNQNSSRKHQNPFFLNGDTKDVLQKRLRQLKVNYENYDFFYKKQILISKIKSLNILAKIYRFFKYDMLKMQRIDYKKEYENPVLHGSCYIFSKLFISAREYAFYPKTFLYYEENILHYQCLKNNLKIFYSPEIMVYHLEDVSTNMVIKNNFEKEKFKMGKMIESLQLFIELMEEDNVKEL